MTLSNFVSTSKKISKPPNFTLDDLILEDYILEEFNICINKIKNYDRIYNDWELHKIDKKPNSVIINFYGPPGTGKTIAAEAIANLFNKNIIEINYSEIFSELMSKNSKNLKSIFNSAREENAILFFDEADSILSRRSSSSLSADNDNDITKSTLLKELDVYNGIVIFATNYFENYDTAFIRRILTHVEFKLPDKLNRERILKYMLSEKIPGRDLLNFEELADKSEGLSGGEIKNIIIKTLAKISNLNKIVQSDLEDEFRTKRISSGSVTPTLSTNN